MDSYIENGERWSVLRFDADGVEELMAHARSCDRHSMGFSERERVYGKGVWDPQPDEEERAPTTLVLVKNEGIYLVSSGVPYMPDPDDPKCAKVVYAQGYDPTKADRMQVWDAARAAVGGADFSEYFDLDTFEAPLAAARTKAGRGMVEMHVSETGIKMMTLAPAGAAPPRPAAAESAPVQAQAKPEETVAELYRTSREKFAAWAAWLLLASPSPLVQWQGDDFVRDAGVLALKASQGERVTQKAVTDLLRTYRRLGKEQDSAMDPLSSARRAAMWFLRTLDPKKDDMECPHNMVAATSRAALIGNANAAAMPSVDQRREYHDWLYKTMNDAANSIRETAGKRARQDDAPSPDGPGL